MLAWNSRGYTKEIFSRGMKREIKRARWRGKIKICTSQDGRELVSARTWRRECRSAGGSCCQLLSGLEKRRSAALTCQQSDSQHSYYLLLSVQTSSPSLSLRAFLLLFPFTLCLSQCLSLPVSVLHSVFSFIEKQTLTTALLHITIHLSQNIGVFFHKS